MCTARFSPCGFISLSSTSRAHARLPGRALHADVIMPPQECPFAATPSTQPRHCSSVVQHEQQLDRRWNYVGDNSISPSNMAEANRQGEEQVSGEGPHTRSSSCRSSREGPSSLQVYASAKAHLSVTDLVGPAWCEYLFQYRILGLAHLPISQRPEKVVTPQGATLVPDSTIAQQREQTLASGKAVHQTLEDEVQPVKVEVRTSVREDRWALRLLQMMVGLQALVEQGCCVSSSKSRPTSSFPILTLTSLRLASARATDHGQYSRKAGPRHR